MKTIKRILALVPAVLVLLFSVVPLASTASSGFEVSGDYPESFSDAFPTLDLLKSRFSDERNTSYVLIHYSSANDPSSSFSHNFRTRTLYIPLGSLNLVENNGIYEVSGIESNSSSSPSYSFYSGFYYLSSGSSTPSCNFSLSSTYSELTSLSIDTAAEDVYINGDYGKFFVMDNVAYNPIYFEFVIDGEQVGSDEIEVESFPKLEGDTSLNIYQLDDEGYKVKDTADNYLSLQMFQIDIKNNSDKFFQYACYIIPKGQSLNYYTNYSEILGSRFFSNNPTFIYITDEIFYNYRGVNDSFTTSYNDNYRQVYAPSAWHSVDANSSESVYIGENQLQLKKDIEYDIVIIGAFIESHKPNHGIIDDEGNIDTEYVINGIDPYITMYSEYDVKEYYRSTFSLDKDTSYCNTQYSDDGSFDMVNTHVYPFDPNSPNNEVFNTIYGQTDYNGNTDYKNDRFNTSYGGAHLDYSGSNAGINTNFGSGVSLTSGFNSFFGMITDLLKHLPGPFLSIFIFGFSSIVVIAIIKAVKS